MIVTVLGILDDGSGQADPTLPRDVRRALAIATGEDLTVRMHLVNRAGVPIELALATGDVVKLSVRTTPSPGRVIVDKNGVRTTGLVRPATYDFVIPGVDTRWGDVRRGIWDVWVLKAASGPTYQVIQPSAFIIRRAAIEPPGAPPVPTP